MFFDRHLRARPALIIDASRQGVLRFAEVQASSPPTISGIQQLDVRGISTFTEALQQIEREHRLNLKGSHCVIAISGVTCGETIRVGRSRWTITPCGLTSLFGRPVTIINNVVAAGWGVKSGNAELSILRGHGVPNFDRQGRYIMINVDQGVGCAVIDIDRSGEITIIETEAGHIEFSPNSDVEARIAAAIKGAALLTTWEKMLVLERQSPAWAAGGPGSMEGQRQRFLAAILGRFAVNLMNAYGAWQGILITGGRTANLLKGPGQIAFASEFGRRRPFSRLISACPAWNVVQREAVLTGAAECLAQGLRAPFAAAA